MPLLTLFGYGALGAFLTYLIAFLLPELNRYLDENVTIIKRRLIILFAIMTLYVVAGGFLTLAVGAPDIKAAVFTGAGWQAFLKGGIETASALNERRR